MKNSKKIIALILAALMSLTVLASCGSDTDTPADDTDAVVNEGGDDVVDDTDPAGDDTVAEAPPAFDPAPIIDNAFGAVNASIIGYLKFDGSDASLSIYTGGEDKSVSGAYTIDETVLKIGDTSFDYKMVGTFLTLQSGDTKYQLTKATDETAANFQGAFALVTGAWSGDGASISFDGASATIKIDGTSIDYTGEYGFDNATSLTIKDTSAGNPTNLALECESAASSAENDTFASFMAFDGDFTTRFSSAYEDLNDIYVDLGSKKTVGGVSIYWEAAHGKEYNIEVSDNGTDWTVVAEERDNSTSGSSDAPVACNYSFDQVEAQYVRMNGLLRATEWGYSIFEMEVYEKLLGEAEISLVYSGDKIALTCGGSTYNLTK